MAGERMVYRGRIDDRYVELGKDRLKPTRHDLEDALDAVDRRQAGRAAETRAVGCILSDLIK